MDYDKPNEDLVKILRKLNETVDSRYFKNQGDPFNLVESDNKLNLLREEFDSRYPYFVKYDNKLDSIISKSISRILKLYQKTLLLNLSNNDDVNEYLNLKDDIKKHNNDVGELLQTIFDNYSMSGY